MKDTETKIAILTEIIQEANEKLTVVQAHYDSAKKLTDKTMEKMRLTSKEIVQFGMLLNQYRDDFDEHPEYTKRFVEERRTTAEQFISDMIAYANKHPGEDYVTFERFVPRATMVIASEFRKQERHYKALEMQLETLKRKAEYDKLRPTRQSVGVGE